METTIVLRVLSLRLIQSPHALFLFLRTPVLILHEHAKCACPMGEILRGVPLSQRFWEQDLSGLVYHFATFWEHANLKTRVVWFCTYQPDTARYHELHVAKLRAWKGPATPTSLAETTHSVQGTRNSEKGFRWTPTHKCNIEM